MSKPPRPTSDQSQPIDPQNDPAQQETELLPTRTAGPTSGTAASADQLPAAIGRYRILSKLGEGGMGVVYEAEQESPRRRVAVKVVRGGQFVDDSRVRLFQREAETLARLEHPNIGAIHESGRTDDGQHFFAMELVHGATLDVYMRERPPLASRGELRLRLSLLRKIADAVQHAHQRGVIHRDLKPSNIIVTENSCREVSASTVSGTVLPDIKILDFGLARITEGDLAATMTTEVGIIRGTLPYMSPEQARGNPAEIDLRTDVYALGVILYEMLSGNRPYDVGKSSIVEAVRVICEETPRPLSTILGRAVRLDPDVETIVGKALEKDADRRYSSAAALSEDITRHLTLQPILARPPSTTYQLRKLIARNKLPTALAGSMFLLLLGFGVWMSVLYARAIEAEILATKEAEISGQVSGFMTELFQVSNPETARGTTISVREMLDQGSERIETELEGQPEVQMRMMATMGGAYRDLGIYKPAAVLLVGALTRGIELFGHEDSRVVGLKQQLAYLLIFTGDHERSESLSREAVATTRKQAERSRSGLSGLLNNMAFGFLWFDMKYEEAEALLREASEIEQHWNAGRPSLNTMYHLAWALQGQGKYDQAETMLHEVLELRRREFEGDHPSIAWTLSRLGDVRGQQGDHEAAVAFLDESLAMNTRLFSSSHPEIAYAKAYLARSHRYMGRLREAEDLQWQALEMMWEVLGNEHFKLGSSFDELARIKMAQGELAEAERYFHEALGINRRSFGENHRRVADNLEGLGTLERRRGNFDQASAHYRRSFEIRRRILGEDDPRTLDVLRELSTIGEQFPGIADSDL